MNELIYPVERECQLPLSGYDFTESFSARLHAARFSALAAGSLAKPSSLDREIGHILYIPPEVRAAILQINFRGSRNLRFANHARA